MNTFRKKLMDNFTEFTVNSVTWVQISQKFPLRLMKSIAI
jgi:hypothetical protein